ncbi:MAG: oligosaccharide flippase family protein [Gemmataceae bacterium]
MSSVHPLIDDLEASARPFAGDADVVPPAVHGSARRAAAWTIAGYGTLQVLRLGFNLILTRLVVPEVFGTMALIGLFVQLLHMFSDLGIRQSVVSHPRGDDPDFLRTAWTLQVLRGLVMWVGSAALAWPVSMIYENSIFTWLLPFAGTVAAVDGLSSTALYVLSRRMRRGPQVAMELGCYVAGTLAGVLGVWLVGRGRPYGPDVQRDQLIALVSGNLVTFLLQTAISHRLLREVEHNFHWDRNAARDLLHFGGWIFLGTASYFLAGQADRLVIGKNQAELGIYNPAVQLSLVPHLLLYELLSQLALPLYAKKLAVDDVAGIPAVHLTLGALGALLISGLIAVGPTFVECIYKPNYRPGEIGFFTQLLAAGTWFGILQYAHETLILASGQSRGPALAQVVKLAIMVPCMFLGYRLAGLTGMVVGFKTPDVLRYIMLAVKTERQGHALWRADVLLTLGIGVAVAVGYGVRSWLLEAGVNKFARLPIEALAVLAVWALVGYALWRTGRIAAVWVRGETAAC